MSVDPLASRLIRAGVAAVFLCTCPVLATGSSILGEGVHLLCSQPRPTALECDYRPLGGQDLGAARAFVGDLEIPAPDDQRRTAADGATAVLMLVDTSDPRRAAAVSSAAAHISAIVDSAGAGRSLGLARFDAELVVLAPLGSAPDVVRGVASKLGAVGPTTELYRNALAAVRLLAAYPAERRALLLFSDGLAEDTAYFHDDVVRAAVAEGVVIYGLGYPRSIARSVELQSLRRLADETGGVFVPATLAFDLPADFLANPLGALDGGGTLRLDLVDAVDTGLANAQRVRLEWSGGARATVPITLPAPVEPEPVVKIVEVEVPRVIEVPTVVEVPVVLDPASTGSAQLAGPPPPTPSSAAPQAWYWPAMLGIGAVVVALLLFVVVRLSRRGNGDAESTEDDAPAGATPPPGTDRFAFLESTDGARERHPVTNVAFRIGRQTDNDLVLRDPSLSRHHAEIHRKRDGAFTITDLESLNGVFVNGKKVANASLSDGDLVEFGDLALNFRVTEDELPGEETVVLRTVVPEFPLEDDNDEEPERNDDDERRGSLS